MKKFFTDYKVLVFSGGTVDAEVEMSDDIRFLYVVDGSASVQVSEHITNMEKSDTLVVNSGEVCHLKMDKSAMLVVISMDYYNLCDSLETASLSFYVNSAEDTGHKYTSLKGYVQELLLAHARTADADTYMERGYFYLLLHALLTDFRALSQEEESTGDMFYARRVIQYIHANYRSNLSLQEIAEQMYLSPSWVSRIFQKATGEHFASYIRKVRLDCARRALEESGFSVAQVAADSGFSTPSLFNRSFKAEYGMTPSEYREQCGVRPTQGEQRGKSREKLLYILTNDQKLSISDIERPLAVQANVYQMRPWQKCGSHVLNVGPAHVLSTAKIQKHVLRLADRLDVEYLRIWNPFSPELMICSEKEYNFTFIDEIMDFCVDKRLKLFIDLAQRRDMAMASESREIYGSENWTEFPSAAAWADTLENFLLHIRRRYHERIVGQWIFELTFFLGDRPYYQDTDYNPRDVWEKGYELIRTCIPTARIAGPGLPPTVDKDSMGAAIQEFLTPERMPDIFTAIIFPYIHDAGTGGMIVNPSRLKKLANRNFLQDQSRALREVLRECGFDGEIWVTDWGCSIANRNFIQDSCFRAAYIAESMLKNQDNVNEMGIFYASDLINVFSDSNTLLSGSAGLLSRDGICKPSYYAYRFLSKLGRFLITQTDNCVVTAESRTELRILCYNNKSLGPKYYLSEENSYRPEQLNRLFSNTDPLSMELVLELPGDGDVYLVRQRILNEERGSILDNWIRFDCSPHLSRSDMEYLERVSTPEILMERMAVVDSHLRLSFRMEPNEIRLIMIMKE